jgi:L-serine dehydratase
MKFISIFNDVLGPVMRGPSSSHTAGSYHIGKLARDLLGEQPAKATFTFSPNGSYANVFRQQGSDLAFVSGLLDWSILDQRFHKALELAEHEDLQVKFDIADFPEADHPNSVRIDLESKSKNHLSLIAKSTGGGVVKVVKLNDWLIDLDGKFFEVFTCCQTPVSDKVEKIVSEISPNFSKEINGDHTFFEIKVIQGLSESVREQFVQLVGEENLWLSNPLYFTKNGEAICNSAQEMIEIADHKKLSLGEVALLYESQLLGISEKECLQEMIRRLKIMLDSIEIGLQNQNVNMQLLNPSAQQIYQTIEQNEVSLGGPHSKAAAKSMAVMHTCNSMEVICAAPTGGAAGVIPAVISTLIEEKKLDEKKAALALFAAGAVGLVTAIRATFAAEIAGCQVEIGAAGAMSAAAVIDAVGGSARQACDSAAIAYQNTMGSVCDLVQGMCEIPCHTRNAVAASSAFVCADLILGGYVNPVNLDETIDAVYSVGKMLPHELRCTTKGGLAITPSALKIKNKKSGIK